MMLRSDAKRLLEKREEKFVAKDYNPAYIVIAKPIDLQGYFVFESAFYEKHEDYYLVFPEHHEAQLFHEDEYYVSAYKIIDDEMKYE